MKLSMSIVTTLCALGLLVAGAAGCDIASGVPVGLESGALVAKIDSIGEFDLTSGVLQKMRKVGKEEDNKWTIFVNDARAACGGVDPESFAVQSVQLELVTSESTVASLQEVFSGPVALQFRDEVSGLTVAVASRFDVTGTGPVSFNVLGGGSVLKPLTTSMMAGDFSVGFIGEAKDVTGTFDMALSMPVSIRAFCPAPSE